MYFNDNNSYPPSPCGYDCNGYYYSFNSSWDTFKNYLAPYIKVPVDPKNDSGAPWDGSRSYAYGNVGNSTYPPQYDLTGSLESTSDQDRCAVKNYHYYFNKTPWCGGYSPQIFEASTD